MKVSAVITLKKDVLDPQGKVIHETLDGMGFNSVNEVRQGKYFEIDVKENDPKKAKEVVESWANGEWFTNKPALEEEIKLTVYKIPGETNTDDLSPATVAFTRADIPLHATAMLQSRMENPLDTMADLKKIFFRAI